ncbi:hypothetical protein [Actinophytocola sp.]|uniref:hypothetical protein n=1 Tax=Actinophytocola sp. TaxID=1872138 RepID=UPI003899AC3D
MPVTDDDLRTSAYRLEGAMIAMLRAAGRDPDIVGNPDETDADVFGESLQIDAEMYMSMNPDELTEEFDEIQKAALDTWLHPDPNGVVDSLKIEIEAWWHGDAAVAFSQQMSHIKNCVDTQYAHTQLAAHAVSMMYALSAQFRASCQDLMEKTADTCAAVAAEQPKPDLDWASIGTSLAKAVIDGIKDADPNKLKDWAVDQLLGHVAEALEPKPVAGDKAGPVVEGYVRARDSLFASYEDNLEQIRAWIQTCWDRVHSDASAIPVPLPASTDVDGPDFRYENFAHVGDSADLAPEVERERERYVDEKPKPSGVIGRRLAGDG